MQRTQSKGVFGLKLNIFQCVLNGNFMLVTSLRCILSDLMAVRRLENIRIRRVKKYNAGKLIQRSMILFIGDGVALWSHV